MHCPIDNANLVMTERQGVEIDYCPQCRGVWLDRGELDKIIERGNMSTAAPVADFSSAERQAYPQARQSNDQYRQDSHYDDRKYHKKHKKENFLGDLFDF